MQERAQGQVGSPGVARYRHSCGVDPPLVAGFAQGPDRVDAFLERLRETGVRGERVVDGQDGGPRLGGQGAGDPVVGVEVAEHPSAAVDVDDHR